VSNILAYAKALVAAAGSVVVLAIAAMSDKAITFDEANGIWLAIVAALTTAGVFAVKNRPPT